VAKPAFTAVRAIADCFTRLGRDCAGTPASASPSTALLPPVAPGQVSTRSVTVTNPGTVPIVLGPATITGATAPGLAVAGNRCAGMVLEPRETCAVSVSFTPVAGGDAAGTLELTTDDGGLSVPLIATAPSLSALRSPELPYPQFIPIGAGDGVGYPQRWRLMLTNPFRARVAIGRATLSGADVRRFRITSDHCAHESLRPHGGCRLTLMFTPTRAGTAQGELTLRGTGFPLTAQLRPVAFALPAVTRLGVPGSQGCAAGPAGLVSATVSQAATVHWMLRRAGTGQRHGCPRASPAGPVLASGTARTRGRTADTARWRLPSPAAQLAPGGYVLTVSAVNDHGAGPTRAMAVRLEP
jgi:hypothetical protein